MKDIESDYWAEGNSNKAARNLYTMLNTRKLRKIKELVKQHHELYKEVKEEMVGWLDNNAILPNGYLYDHMQNKDKEKQNKWKHANKMMSEKNPMIVNTSSFESLIMFLLHQDNTYLRKLQKQYIESKKKKAEAIAAMQAMPAFKSKKKIVKGGGDSYEILHKFLQIHPENAATVKSIIKLFDKLDWQNKPHADEGKELVNELGENMAEYWKTRDIFMHSSRTQVFWNITIFLLSLDSQKLTKYYQHVKELDNKNKAELRRIRRVLQKYKK